MSRRIPSRLHGAVWLLEGEQDGHHATTVGEGCEGLADYGTEAADRIHCLHSVSECVRRCDHVTDLDGSEVGVDTAVSDADESDVSAGGDVGGGGSEGDCSP